MDTKTTSLFGQNDSSKIPVLTIAVLLLLVAVIAIWYWRGSFSLQKKERPPESQNQTVKEPTAKDLGTQLYQKSTNPLENKLPATVAPVPNPIQGVYKNPFQ